MAHRRTTSAIAVLLAVGLVGCGAGRPDSAATNAVTSPPTDTETTASPESDTLTGLGGELVLTRQRDLLDRGLINVLTRNDSGVSMLLSDVALDVDFFDAVASAPRTVSVRDGRRVAIQVPYGVAADCDTDRPVAAELLFTYVTDQHPVPRPGSLALAGTAILDVVRAEQCAARRFEADVQAQFENIAVTAGELTADLVLEPTGTGSDLAVTGVTGTILVAVSAVDGWPGAVLDSQPATIPLTFSVNRCDPHALAEVTKRFGLDLAVAVDGADPVTVAMDIGELVPGLETIVEQCTLATNAD